MKVDGGSKQTFKRVGRILELVVIPSALLLVAAFMLSLTPNISLAQGSTTTAGATAAATSPISGAAVTAALSTTAATTVAPLPDANVGRPQNPSAAPDKAGTDYTGLVIGIAVVVVLGLGGWWLLSFRGRRFK